MAERVLRSNVLSNQAANNHSYSVPASGIVTLSRELLADLKTRGLNYLHVANNGEGGQMFVVASKNKSLTNQLPQSDITKQLQEGLVGLSQINTVGIRLGEGGPVISSRHLIVSQQVLQSGLLEQEGLDWQSRLKTAPANRLAP